MNRSSIHNRCRRKSRPAGRPRRGSTILETVIAAIAVMTMLSIAAPMVLRTARIWKQTQHHQFACDELAGQMDRLIAMPAETRQEALSSLSVSQEIRDVLVDATLSGEIKADDDGKRVILSLDWRRSGDPPPLQLVAWIDPVSPTQTSEVAMLPKTSFFTTRSVSEGSRQTPKPLANASGFGKKATSKTHIENVSPESLNSGHSDNIPEGVQ